MARDILIIGAGHNGLVAAFYLGQAGLSVELVEARGIIGGACTTQELISGYRFSTCANVLPWLRPKVAEDLRLLERGLHVEVLVAIKEIVEDQRIDALGLAVESNPRIEVGRTALDDHDESVGVGRPRAREQGSEKDGREESCEV